MLKRTLRTTTQRTTRAFYGTAAAGGGPSFSPSDLTGLQLWLDASDSSTVLNSISPDTPATDGQAVRRWLDKSGNDRHANQSTGVNQPLLDADGLNSKGVLTFDGINDFFTSGTTSSYNFLHNGTESLVVIVFKVEPSDPNASYRLLGTLNDTLNVSAGYILAYEDRAAVRNNSISTAVATNLGINAVVDLLDADVFPSQQFQILEHKVDADNATAADRSVVNIDGQLQNGNNTDTAPATTLNALTSLGIGATQTPSSFLNGAIAEIIICNDPNTANRSSLRTYLASKWGITLS